jgi:Domain of unknown function (DUF5666)
MFRGSTQWSARAWWATALVALLSAALLAGCGGGGSSAPTETASSYTEGPVDGFGSVIVNGVRFDDSTAAIEDEDGVVQPSSELKLGTMVEVDASDVRDLFARALRFRVRTDIVGPVDSVDATGSTLVVLGQVVEVKTTTVFADDLPGGLSGLAPGTVVGVHAHFDSATGHYLATRIDARPFAPVYRLRGFVSHLDTTAKTFRIGSEVISYAGIPVADLPSNLADGLRVRVRLQKVEVNGQWIALSVRHGVRPIGIFAQAHVRGTVSSFTSTTQFSVNGIPVDASNAIFPDGTAGLVLGARVGVHGRAENGVIIARRVELDDDLKILLRGFELHGAVNDLDAAAKTFMLRGVKVNYSAAAFANGTPGDLANGRKVEAKGALAVDRRVLAAATVKFED